MTRTAVSRRKEKPVSALYVSCSVNKCKLLGLRAAESVSSSVNC